MVATFVVDRCSDWLELQPRDSDVWTDEQTDKCTDRTRTLYILIKRLTDNSASNQGPKKIGKALMKPTKVDFRHRESNPGLLGESQLS